MRDSAQEMVRGATEEETGEDAVTGEVQEA